MALTGIGKPCKLEHQGDEGGEGGGGQKIQCHRKKSHGRTVQYASISMTRTR